ncbi:hypothetical protein C4D60_Mb00t17790 [Musa balbisiana]|uniref:Uncharacterized protein n=1 Tax=Musa balbisiana TaxID=52838 RepID=A0A4S8I411_MUSBA|nr:hypothetical protein C4D60_Mb00t17790 [Musa balbisiana]
MWIIQGTLAGVRLLFESEFLETTSSPQEDRWGDSGTSYLSSTRFMVRPQMGNGAPNNGKNGAPNNASHRTRLEIAPFILG